MVGSPATRQKALEIISRLGSTVPSELSQLKIELFRTRISGLYAITVGGESNKADALSRARAVRATGWVRDAFAERNRGWEKQNI